MSVKRGFLLGKFMPVHNGHLFMCDVANAMVDELTVLVCTRDCEPIDGQLRFDWITKCAPPDIKLIHLHKDIPQEPSEHVNFWNIWKATIKEAHPETIDVVFGSEEYVIHLANELGAEPFVVDIDRKNIPISATQIRSAPYENWKYIPEPVRSYYQRNICLLGPESAGKTTLTKLLADTYMTEFIREYGRDYDAEFKQGTDWTDVDFTAIVNGQIALRDATVKHSNYVLFEDTDILQTIVWAEYLLGYIPHTLKDILESAIFADFYLLLNPDVAWIDDGTRYAEDQDTRLWFFDRLKTLLKEFDLNYVIIDGKDWGKRVTLAHAAVGKWLTSNT
ncbi:AAA family ATPase [Amylibacter sp. SFDW26]|uniref:AAA family ATPase n=1 Tax=Amylibacter sp. SFDW26 TaxID=2652722 RepID=UPI0012619091|nr:AAA family ATPase [Amylibacter sp. SFDW26]KAB7616337.1 AAA family ATPase [Amylibacter sp. SFDW26]